MKTIQSNILANIPQIAIAPQTASHDIPQAEAEKMYELRERMSDQLRATDDVDVITGNLVADLAALTTAVGRLGYLRYFSTGFTTPGKVKLAPRDTVELLHGMSAVIDAHTPHITPRGELFRMIGEIYNATSPLFQASLQRERELITARSLDRVTSQRIADIHSVFARKGRTYYLLDEKERGRADPADLILFAATTVARYAALDMQEPVDGIRTFMRSLMDYMGVKDPSEESALRHLEEFIEGFPLIGNMASSYDVGIKSMFRGLYLYTPHLYTLSSERLSALGQDDIAEKHASRAQRDQEIADHLGLKQP